MSRILISFYQPIVENDVKNLFCFYDSLSSEFSKAGNEVLLLNLAFFKHHPFDSAVINKESLVNQVKTFSPELIIAYNNQIFDGLLENTDCPIAVWDADSIEFFSCKQLLRDNIDRFTMITSFKYWIDRYVNFGFDKSKVHYIPLATSIQKENIQQNKNISFIGTFFGHSFKIYDKYLAKNQLRPFYDLYQEFLENPQSDCATLVKKMNLGGVESLSPTDFHVLCDIRVNTLVSLLDLDLHLYGRRWSMFKETIPQLFLAFNPSRVYSLKHNQEIYNSSKIGLSINHPQNQGNAFPWRVFDVMASNACLVSSYSRQLEELTKGWVDIPMFHTPQEARELCVKLLKEENYRKDLVAASQNFIEKNARWHNRFEDLGAIFNLNLINNPENGSISFIEDTVQKNPIVLNNSLNENKDNEKADIFHFKTRLFNKFRLEFRIKRDVR